MITQFELQYAIITSIIAIFFCMLAYIWNNTDLIRKDIKKLKAQLEKLK